MSYWFPDWSAMEKERKREGDENQPQKKNQADKILQHLHRRILFPRGKVFFEDEWFTNVRLPFQFFTLMRSLMSSCQNVNHMISGFYPLPTMAAGQEEKYKYMFTFTHIISDSDGYMLMMTRHI
jgi:hypothetical protein